MQPSALAAPSACFHHPLSSADHCPHQLLQATVLPALSSHTQQPRRYSLTHPPLPRKSCPGGGPIRRIFLIPLNPDSTIMTPPSSSGPDARSHLQYIPEPIPIQPRPPGCITNVPIDTTVPAPRGPSLSSVPPAGPLPASGIDQSPTSVSGIQGVQDPIQLVDAVDEDYEKPKASGGLQAPALQVTGATQVSQQDVAPIAEDAPRRSFSGPHPPPFSFRSSSQLDQASLPAAPLPIKRARQAPTDVQTDQLDVSDFEGDEDDAGADADSSAPSSRRHSTADGLAASFSSLHPTQGTAQAPHPSRASFGQAAAHSTSPAVGLGSLLKRVRAQREAAEAAASESWIEEEGRDHGEKQQTRNVSNM